LRGSVHRSTATAVQKGASAIAATAVTEGHAATAGRPLNGFAVVAIGVAGAAAAAVVAVITYRIDEPAPGVDAALVVWIMLAYIFGGLIVWSRRPDGRLGRLMVISGFGPFFSRISEADGDAPQAVGDACRLLPVVLFLHVFLAYPVVASSAGASAS
jgi:hypothetical protein